MSIPANRFIRVFLPKIAKIATKASLNQIGFGLAGDVLFEAADSFFKGAAPTVSRKELEEIIQKPAEFAKKVEDAIADQPAEVQAAAKLYFDQVPEAIRRGALTLGGRDGIARGTLSNEIPLLNAKDLWVLIPQEIANFKVGDKPVESTDLELTGFLGKGGFGEVWRAKHSNRPFIGEVVLKFCNAHTVIRSMKSLQREVDLLDRIGQNFSHPQIVKLLYSHLNQLNPCLEYEFVDGGDLEQYIERRHENRLTPTELVDLMIQIVEPVAFAHTLEIVHRDLKPRNILVSVSQGREIFKITDFGIGGIIRREERRHSHPSGTSQHSTMSRGTYTPIYASPQQQDGENASKLDDVFALGVIWYQLLLNDLTKRAPSGAAWKTRLVANQATKAMTDLLESCVESEEEDRLRDAGLLLDGLKSIRNAVPKGTRPEKSLDWAEILEVAPDPKVITNPDLLERIAATGYPWRVVHKTTGIEMLLVPPGNFEMGMSAGDVVSQDDEKPLHEVTLTRPFYLGTKLVSQHQWSRILARHLCRFTGDSLPLDSVSFQELTPFFEATGLRLPTEAEWECACRGDSRDSRYGDLDQIAWHKDNCDHRTHSCGEKLPNSLGFSDMLGNLWEWCSDWYDKGFYNECEDGVVDPGGPTSGALRVLRGGSWKSVRTGCRASDRKEQSPQEGGDNVGFRVARNP